LLKKVDRLIGSRGLRGSWSFRWLSSRPGRRCRRALLLRLWDSVEKVFHRSIRVEKCGTHRSIDLLPLKAHRLHVGNGGCSLLAKCKSAWIIE